MPPPETCKSEIGSQSTMCQVYTWGIRLINRAWKNLLYRLPPKKDHHVYITRSIYHYAYARQTQVDFFLEKRNKEQTRRERKGKRREERTVYRTRCFIRKINDTQPKSHIMFRTRRIRSQFLPSSVREGKWLIENEPKYQTVVRTTDRKYGCASKR